MRSWIPYLLILKTIMLCWSTVAYSQAYQYHRVYQSPYYLGRGDTGIAIADEQHALFYNPAGLAYGKGIYKKWVLATPTVGGSMAARDLARKLEVEEAPERDALMAAIGQPQHIFINATTAIVLRRAAIGAFSQNAADILVAKSKESRGLESVKASLLSDQGLVFGVAEKIFSDSFMVGVGVKILQRGFVETEVGLLDSDALATLKEEGSLTAGDGTAIDVGLMWRGSGRRPMSLGLTVENVGNTPFTAAIPDQELDPMLQTVNFGFAVEPGTRFSKLRLLIDYRDLTGALGKQPIENLRLGTEISMKDYLGFTTGIHDGYFSGGAYVDVRFLRFDIGAYTKEVGAFPGNRPDSRFFFQIQLAL